MLLDAAGLAEQPVAVVAVGQGLVLGDVESLHHLLGPDRLGQVTKPLALLLRRHARRVHSDRTFRQVPGVLVLCLHVEAEHKQRGDDVLPSAGRRHPTGRALLAERGDALLTLLAGEVAGGEFQQGVEREVGRPRTQQPLGLGQRGGAPAASAVS